MASVLTKALPEQGIMCWERVNYHMSLCLQGGDSMAQPARNVTLVRLYPHD